MYLTEERDYNPNRTILRLPRRVDIVNAEQPTRDGTGYNSWEQYKDLTLTPEIVHNPDTGDRGRLLYREGERRGAPAKMMIDGAGVLRSGFVIICALVIATLVW